MIKKSTLYVLALAIVLGAIAYYFDWKKGADKPANDASKPAFTVHATDITSLTVTRPASGEPPIQMAKKGDDWQIVQPVETAADFASAQGIVDGVAGSRVEQIESGASDRLKAYGLDHPQVTLDFQTSNGPRHSIAFGSADFTGNSVYTLLDGSQTVSLLPKSLLTSVDKSFNDLRDHSVLAIKATQVTSFDLKNSNGELTLAKDAGGWKFTKPTDARADDDAVSAFLGSLESARMTSVIAEKPDNPQKYGLVSPALTFVADSGSSGKSTLLIGKEDGGDYYARDLSRPQIFKINDDLFKKFGVAFAGWRDKKVARFDQDQTDRVEIRNANGDIALVRKKNTEGDWAFDAPADQKGKSAAVYKVFSPLDSLRAADVVDHPSSDITASLAKPAIEITLTDKAGKALTLRISKESSGFVYAQTSVGATVFKLKSDSVQDLNLMPADLII